MHKTQYKRIKNLNVWSDTLNVIEDKVNGFALSDTGRYLLYRIPLA